MINASILTMSSFIVSIALLMVYVFQNKDKNAKNKLYLILIAINIALCLFEIVSAILLDVTPGMLGLILLKTKWVIFVVYNIFLYLYTIVFIYKNKDITFKELILSLAYKPLLILMVIAMILIYVLKTGLYNLNAEPLYFGEYTSYIIIGVMILNLFILEVQGLKKSREFNSSEKKYIFMIIILNVISLVAQILLPNVGILPFGNTLFIMYIMMENPDLHTLNKLEEESSNRHQNAKLGFVSNISTDIKNSMNDMNSTINSILTTEEMETADLKKNIKKVNKVGHEILHIINNLLAISNIENGSEGLVSKPYSLRDLIEDCANNIKATLETKGIQLITNIKEIPESLLGDEEKLKQIISNILENAVTYIEKGSITINVSAQTVEKVANIHISIADTGKGISDGVRGHIFEKYDDNEKSHVGLYVAKQYLDLMEGRISFESKEMIGTTFYIDFAQVISQDTAKEKDYVDFTGKRVLVVDDNKLNLTVAKKMLGLYNIEAVTAATGEECVNIINGSKGFDLILLDQSMPGMDGVETFKKIKTLNAMTKIPPIIAFTANAIDGMKESYEAEGFDDYLSKPIVKEDLDRILTTYIKK